MKEATNTLVILSPAFPENEAATYWVPSQQLMVKALKANFPNWRIIVLTLLYPYHESTYTWYEVEVISFDGNHHRKLRRLRLWRNVWRQLSAIHRRYTITGLFSFWCGEGACIGKYFGKQRGIPHLSWICGQDARAGNPWIKFIRPRSSELAAMSSSLASEFLKNHGVQPQLVIPNAIDTHSFPAARHVPRDIDLLAVGSFEPLKQYDLFTRVVDKLRQHFSSIHAVHCGMGREKDKIASQIASLKLGNHLKLMGAKTHEEILSLMMQARVFVHPSNYEGFSTVCLEALYAGMHVVSFCYPLDHPVPHWHVVSSEQEMTDTVIKLLSQPQLDHEPVLLYNMEESAKAVMQFFERHPGNDCVKEVNQQL